MIDILFLVSWWGLWLLLPICSPHYKRLWYSIVLCSLVTAGSLSAYYYYRAIYPQGIIRDDIVLRVGPHETYGTCGTCKAHDKIVVCDVRDAWKHVKKNGSGVRGWIPENYVTLDIS